MHDVRLNYIFCIVAIRKSTFEHVLLAYHSCKHEAPILTQRIASSDTANSEHEDGHTHDRHQASTVKITKQHRPSHLQEKKKAPSKKSAPTSMASVMPKSSRTPTAEEHTEERGHHQELREDEGRKPLRDSAVDSKQTASEPAVHAGHSMQQQIGHKRHRHQHHQHARQRATRLPQTPQEGWTAMAELGAQRGLRQNDA